MVHTIQAHSFLHYTQIICMHCIVRSQASIDDKKHDSPPTEPPPKPPTPSNPPGAVSNVYEDVNTLLRKVHTSVRSRM